MFCKCYFASLWEQAEVEPSKAAEPVRPQVQLRPVFLPAVSYLVESSEGWLSSCYARFQQARRHSQGVAELSYVLLQYLHMLTAFGASRLPVRTHAAVMSIIGKLVTLHIINSVQAFALLVSILLLVLEAAAWAWAGGLASLLASTATEGILGAVSLQLGGLKWALFAIFGPIPPVGWFMMATTYSVVRDTLEGRLTHGESLRRDADDCSCSKAAQPQQVAPDVQGSALAVKGSTVASLGWRRKVSLFLMIQWDMLNLAEVTLVFYGLIPVVLAAWSLLRNGTHFEYIVAAKPN